MTDDPLGKIFKKVFSGVVGRLPGVDLKLSKDRFNYYNKIIESIAYKITSNMYPNFDVEVIARTKSMDHRLPCIIKVILIKRGFTVAEFHWDIGDRSMKISTWLRNPDGGGDDGVIDYSDEDVMPWYNANATEIFKNLMVLPQDIYDKYLTPYITPLTEGYVHDTESFGEVIENPNRDQFVNLLQSLRYPEEGARALLTPNGEIFAWDSYNANHDQMSRQLGLDFKKMICLQLLPDYHVLFDPRNQDRITDEEAAIENIERSRVLRRMYDNEFEVTVEGGRRALIKEAVMPDFLRKIKDLVYNTPKANKDKFDYNKGLIEKTIRKYLESQFPRASIRVVSFFRTALAQEIWIEIIISTAKFVTNYRIRMDFYFISIIRLKNSDDPIYVQYWDTFESNATEWVFEYIKTYWPHRIQKENIDN